MKALGFTGTREGMTPAQREAVQNILVNMAWSEGHHGDCVGADAEFDALCQEARIKRHIHPPVDGGLRAWSQEIGAVLHEPLPYLKRNAVIVESTDWLVACPKEPVEAGGGTWWTVRYARAKERPDYRIVIVSPKGRVTTE